MKFRGFLYIYCIKNRFKMIKKILFTLVICFACIRFSNAQSEFHIKLDKKNRVKEIGTFTNDKKDGIFISFRRNGKFKTNYYKNGKKLTASEVNLEQLNNATTGDESFGFLLNEQKNGIWFTLNTSKRVTNIQHYKAGVLEGKVYYFHADYEVMRIENYENGKKNGVSEEFHSGGALHYSTEYKNGKIVDGENIYYHPNGNKKFVDNYKNGLKFGKSTVYFESGAVEIEGIYRDKGLQEGPWKEYYESGKLKEEYNYKHGLFHGEYTIYDEEGNILQQYIYKNDKLIKTIVK